MLVREVFGWLRFCLQQDILCKTNQVVVEEIPAIHLSVMDTNDGPRVLAIYCASKGFTPRIEIRFTANFPQIWWIDANDKGTYVLSPYSSKFPGDFRMWSRSEFVRYLVDLAKSKLCHDTVTLVSLIPSTTAKAETTAAGPKADFDTVKRVVDAAHRALRKGDKTKFNSDYVNKWLKENVGIDLFQFAFDLFYYFSKGKLEWKDVSVFEKGSDGKGHDLVPWTFLQSRLLDNPKLYGKIPPTVIDQIEASSINIEESIRNIVKARNEGRPVKDALNPRLTAGEFGLAVEASLHTSKTPLPYLSLLEKADLKEEIAPWSLIRRSVLAYDCPSPSTAHVADTILNWLEGAQLTVALYKNDTDVLKELLHKKLCTFASTTVQNPHWTKEVLDTIAGITEPQERTKALQSEFDLWLLQALSPSVASTKLPLSPYAYNSGIQEEKLYSEVFASWLGALKQSAADRRESSVKNLSHALESFYSSVTSKWKTDCLDGYRPRIPAVKEIMSASLKGDKDKLFKVLVADLEDEVGIPMAEDVCAGFKESPFFNSIYKEIRFQSVRL